MNHSENRAMVGRALTILTPALQAYVDSVLTPLHDPWTELFRIKDARPGQNRQYSASDPALLLRAIGERLGEHGFPFDATLSRMGKVYADELRQVRNGWAHHSEFDADQTARALQTVQLFAREIGASGPAEQIAALRAEQTVGTPRVEPDATAPPVRVTVSTPAVPSPAKVAAESTPGPTMRTPPVPGPAPARTATTIDVRTKPVLSYALVHCGVPIVEAITVTHTTSLRGATLELTARSAAGPLGETTVLRIDSEPAQTLQVANADLHLDPARMLALDEQQPGVIEVVLRDPTGQVLARAERGVDVLAGNQWVDRPILLGLELLAAHIQPNAAAVQALLRETSDLLADRTGSGALAPAVDDPGRIDALVTAMYDAMRGRGIHYAPPPASWGAGQKIRTPAEVLDGRLGTCLDTTVTLAAALEQAGVAPLVWLLKDHAFLGYWRTTPSSARAATQDARDLANRVDLGQVGLVETTLLTGDGTDFAEATRAARRSVEGDLAELLGVLDLRQARQNGILPLPSRAPDGAPLVADGKQTPGASTTPGPQSTEQDATAADAGTSTPLPRIRGPERVERWKNELLDLTAASELIDASTAGSCRLELPGPGLRPLVEQILTGQTLHLVPGDDLGALDGVRNVRHARELPERVRLGAMTERSTVYLSPTIAEFVAVLRQLAAHARTIQEESGSHGLYLTAGRLHWHCDDRDLSSPVVLIPVHLDVAPGGSSRLRLADDGAAVVNRSLLEKLQSAYGLRVPAFEGTAAAEPSQALDGLRAAVADAGLSFRVEDRLDLAALGFAKIALWTDLDTHYDQLCQNPLVNHLVHSPLAAFDDPAPRKAPVDLDWLTTILPLSADGSQAAAVAQALAGRTFVLQGPPGTGKSQTITNIVARGLGSGLKVLLVAKKQVALDVVHDYLVTLGLDALCLDLRGPRTGTLDVHRQLTAALELTLSTPATPTATLEEDRRRLRAYAGQVHEPNAAGYSLSSAFRRCGEGSPSSPLDISPRTLAALGADQVGELRAAVASTAATALAAHPRRDHPWGWLDLIPKRFDPDAALRVARQFDAALQAAGAAGIEPPDVDEAIAADELAGWAHVAGAPRYPLADLDDLRTRCANRVDALCSVLNELAHDSSPWRQVLAPEAVELDVPTLHKNLLHAGRGPRRWLKADTDALRDGFGQNLLPGSDSLTSTEAREVTASLLATRQQVKAVRAMVSELPVKVSAAELNPADPDQAAALGDQIADAYRTALALDGTDGRRARLRTFFRTTPQGAGRAELAELVAAWRALTRTFTTTTVPGFASSWSAGRSERSLTSTTQLDHWSTFVRTLEPLRSLGLTEFRERVLDGRAEASTLVEDLERALSRASVPERLAATGLVGFDQQLHHGTIERFTDDLEHLQESLPAQILAAAVKARRFAPDDLGALRRATGRRGVRSLRTLLAEHSSAVLQILPCVLASPQDVARYLPAQAGLFDIVLFDEASQIPVAEAIAALGRARSAVIVGDPAQMPPSRFMETRTRWDPDGVEDEESILDECVMAGVPRLDLSWHYRSTEESLIAFSNRNYYGGRLRSFPAPRRPGGAEDAAGRGVRLVRVDGTFHRTGSGSRTNPVEAAAVVDEVRRRFAASPQVMPSLGVITFNRPQADLIDRLLRKSDNRRLLRALEEPGGLFVKNLENVQGDERDSILLSVGYSANTNGAVALTMGPLSAGGGERRLNVAVTRARSEMVVFTSFDPEQLDVSSTNQLGLQHLREYLEFAKAGGRTDAGAPRGGNVDRYRDDVAASLQAAGYVVRTDIGWSAFTVDLAVTDPENPDRDLVAVLLDGPQWANRATVTDRDLLPVHVLRDLMGWPQVVRLWLPEWIADRAGALARIQAAVQVARAGQLDLAADAGAVRVDV